MMCVVPVAVVVVPGGLTGAEAMSDVEPELGFRPWAAALREMAGAGKPWVAVVGVLPL